MTRTRFAPSPTGFVHIGSLRTALFSFLFARHNRGVHVLRIEDTDQNRVVAGALENLLTVMKQVDVEFDEGFYIKDDGTLGERGEYGPYLQSKRLNKYQTTAKKLMDSGNAYPCFCSQERLDELKKEQIALKKPPMYDRACRNLNPDEIKRKSDEFKSVGKNPVVRFAVPLAGKTIINDLIHGDIAYDHTILDDQVIIKSDGFPTYHLAVVVDDHFMKITHVIRGEEWLPSTPKHVLIYKALGWEPTQFAHLPLILNPDKSKLSKRQGDAFVEDFLKHGYLKEALINFVAFLGWNPKTDQELFSLSELIEQFSLDKVNKAGAVFDDGKLNWFNSQYIKKLSADDLAEKLKPFWREAGIETAKYGDKYLMAIAKLEQERLKKLSEIGERTQYFFKAQEYDGKLLVWKKSTSEEAKARLETLVPLFEKLTDQTVINANELRLILETHLTETKSDKGSVLWPLRVSLTGLEKSPPPFDVAATLALGLGKQEILNRLQTAISKL
ncbi:MAG: glutamate--tRNA ligase [Candidatus Doudnabacteria bacterium]|nr:glutamate--tRNA ligase [Candidatus Doudnabacteria bacterium]